MSMLHTLDFTVTLSGTDDYPVSIVINRNPDNPTFEPIVEQLEIMGGEIIIPTIDTTGYTPGDTNVIHTRYRRSRGLHVGLDHTVLNYQ